MNTTIFRAVILICVVTLGLSTVSAAEKIKEAWKPGSPAFKAKEEKHNPKATVTGNKITLENRGIAISTKPHGPGLVTFTAKWRYTKGRNEGAYQDVLSVAFHTDGKQRDWSCEIQQGMVVKFQAHAGKITIEHWKKGVKSPKVLAEVKGIAMKRNTDYAIKITVGEQVQVWFGKDQKKTIAKSKNPLLNGKLHQVAMYNREPVAAVEQESVLTDVALK